MYIRMIRIHLFTVMSHVNEMIRLSLLCFITCSTQTYICCFFFLSTVTFPELLYWW